MRFYQTIGNFTFEFNDIPQFIAFTIGRLLALPIFIGLFILWYLILYWLGYIDSLEPLIEVWHLFF